MIKAKLVINPNHARLVRTVKKSTLLKVERPVHRRIKKIGNSKIIIHSDLFLLSKKNRQAWWDEQVEKENPTVMNIIRTVHDIYRAKAKRELEER
ncbi:hypothetical protein ACQCVO_05405 [Bacillus infantis]|uniref:hypothetical protein n=1 Tax=Bacillus infantis TaxID=324767 RepID=UPI003CE8877A